MLVQNLQTGFQSGSGIFSVSGGNAGSKDKNSNIFAGLFESMTAGFNSSAFDLKAVNSVTDVQVKNDLQPVENKQPIQNNLNNKQQNDVKNISDNTGSADKTVLKQKVEQNSLCGTEEIEKISSALVDIVVAVSEFFDITPEELSDIMSDMGMKLSDLTDIQDLKALFVKINCGNDFGVLLTDENMLNSCKELMDTVTDLWKKEGVIDDLKDSLFASVRLSDEENENSIITRANELIKEDNITCKNEKNEENSNLYEFAETKRVVIEKTGDTNGKESNMNRENSSNNSSSEDLFNTFLNNVIGQVDDKFAEFNNFTNMNTELRAIAEQILNQIKVNITPDNTSIEIQLTPEHLGKVNVSVENNDGVLTARFRTDNQVTKEAIESNIMQFKEQLSQQGIKVDSVEVTVSQFAFDKNPESNKNGNEKEGKNRRHFTLEEINEKTDGPDLREQSYLDNGTSTVSYVA